MNLGNVGDTNTLAWLFCDIQSFGKTLIRKGHREGLPIEKPSVWVFCPLLRKNFPRDRQLIEECQKCPHYKGVSHNLKKTHSQEDSWKPQMIIKSQPKPKQNIIKEDFMKAIEESKKENEEWETEERRIFGKSNRGFKICKNGKA